MDVEIEEFTQTLFSRFMNENKDKFNQQVSMWDNMQGFYHAIKWDEVSCFSRALFLSLLALDDGDSCNTYLVSDCRIFYAHRNHPTNDCISFNLRSRLLYEISKCHWKRTLARTRFFSKLF
jgi:hypothetical protein